MNEEKAILYIMEFYRVSREVACEFYRDEIEAYMSLQQWDDAIQNIKVQIK